MISSVLTSSDPFIVVLFTVRRLAVIAATFSTDTAADKGLKVEKDLE
jgi:hypothetical protein